VREYSSGGRLRVIDLTASAVATASSLGVTGAALWAAGRFFGEKLFGHWLEGRLQRQKEEHALDLEKLKGAQSEGLEQLKNEQNREIEKLRGDIGHLQDRGKHSNEREYAALAEIWEKFSDFHSATTDFRAAFYKLNIFVPGSLTDEFDKAAGAYLSAVSQRELKRGALDIRE
jgi:cytochrome c556